MNNKKKIFISFTLIIISIFLLYDKAIRAEEPIISKVEGKILLQVESHGEAWYVNPINQKRYYLGRPDDAFELMNNISIGISNNDLVLIPVAEANFGGIDADGDGLSDAIENSFGTDKNNADTDSDGYNDKDEILNSFNPLDSGPQPTDANKVKSLAGKIVLQVEQNGEAWYVYPDNLKRYFLGRPLDAFNLMRNLGLGITNTNLAKIDEIQINPEYKSEAIVKKYTTPSKQLPNSRKYNDPDIKYSLEYPAGWKIQKYESSVNTTYFTDAIKDFVIEKKGVITITYFKTDNTVKDVNIFRIATKGESNTLTDAKKKINDKNAYENSYRHNSAYEKTTTIKINSSEFIQTTLLTANYNNNYYNNEYNKLINSIEFSSTTCETCQ